MQVLNDEGYNIKTTAFQVAGIGGNVYLSDVPDSDRLTGSLFLFSLPNVGSRNPSIVKSNVGSIGLAKRVLLPSMQSIL